MPEPLQQPPKQSQKAHAPRPAVEVLTLRQGPLRTEELREQALGWIKANNRWGPDHSFAKDHAKELDAKLERSDGFQIGFGPKLLKSQKAMLLAGHRGGLFLVELPEEVAREWKLEGSWRSSQKLLQGQEVRPEKARAELSGLVVDNSQKLDNRGPVTGSVNYRIRERSPGPLALRLTFYYTKYRRSVLCYPKQLECANQGVLSFTLPPLASARVQPRGPLLVFVELLTGTADQGTIESNAVAALVTVTAGE
jgi:hypothetical protein